MVILLVILGAVAVIWLIVVASRGHAARERARISAIWAWGQANGFAFHKDDPFNLDSRFSGIGDIGRGHSRYAFEVLSRSDPVNAFSFRYHFATTETRVVTTTDSRGNTTTRTETYEQDHWRVYLIVELGSQFPAFHIRQEHWGDRVAGFMGMDDIDFESEEFSRRYFIKSADRQFAYAVIHPQMMEWLMTREFSARMDRGCFVAEIDAPQKDASARHAAWMAAVGFVNRIPPFVWEDFGKRKPIQLPESRPPTPLEPFEPGSKPAG